MPKKGDQMNLTLALATMASANHFGGAPSAPPQPSLDRDRERLVEKKKLSDMIGLRTRIGGGANRAGRRHKAKALKAEMKG